MMSLAMIILLTFVVCGAIAGITYAIIQETSSDLVAATPIVSTSPIQQSEGIWDVAWQVWDNQTKPAKYMQTNVAADRVGNTYCVRHSPEPSLVIIDSSGKNKSIALSYDFGSPVANESGTVHSYGMVLDEGRYIILFQERNGSPNNELRAVLLERSVTSDDTYVQAGSATTIVANLGTSYSYYSRGGVMYALLAIPSPRWVSVWLNTEYKITFAQSSVDFVGGGYGTGISSDGGVLWAWHDGGLLRINRDGTTLTEITRNADNMPTSGTGMPYSTASVLSDTDTVYAHSNQVVKNTLSNNRWNTISTLISNVPLTSQVLAGSSEQQTFFLIRKDSQKIIQLWDSINDRWLSNYVIDSPVAYISFEFGHAMVVSDDLHSMLFYTDSGKCELIRVP